MGEIEDEEFEVDFGSSVEGRVRGNLGGLEDAEEW